MLAGDAVPIAPVSRQIPWYQGILQGTDLLARRQGLLPENAAIQRLLDRRRRAVLEEMKARGGPTNVHDVMLVLMMPVIELGDDERWRGYIRFTSNLQASDPGTLRAALNNRWNSGYVDCFEYLKKMLPLPAAVVEQRLSIFMIYADAILSAHEAAQEKRHATSSRLWGQPFTIENILDTLEAALTYPPSEQTQVKLLETGGGSVR